MKKVIRILLILLGTGVILMYCPPLFVGVLNIGNGFGFAIGGALILIGIFMDKILILYQNKTWKKIISAVCILAVFGAGVFSVTLGTMLFGNQKHIYGNEPVIVLGCQVHGDKPSNALRQRVMAGVKYLRTHPDAAAIVCGGKGRGESISEAECMKNLMLEKGIDENRIYLEDKSTSTDENIMFARGILEENNLGNKVVIATSEYHQYRAVMIAEKHGLTAASQPAPSSKAGRPTFYTREVFGVLFEMIKQIV